MASIRFEWDPVKNAKNLRKHGIKFEQTVQAFLDPLQVLVLDRVVNGEERWHTYAQVDRMGVLMICHTLSEESDGADVVRIISARRATRTERQYYEEKTC